MLREEAIAELKEAMDEISLGSYTYDGLERSIALEMGIKALEQEPTVQDKQAESEKYQKAYDDGYADGYAQARFDFEPKTGHWIYREDMLDYECSECGRVIETHRFENPYIRYPYCHCGARMLPTDSEKE